MDRLPLRCWKCDYDLTGLDPEGECPECGARIDVNRPGKENLPLALSALAFGVFASLLTPGLAITGIFRHDSGVTLIMSLGLAALLTVPSFRLASKAEPPRPAGAKIRPQYPMTSYARLFSLGTIVYVSAILVVVLLTLLGGR